MITRLKRRITESLTFSLYKKVTLGSVRFYQDANKDYNGLYRLIDDLQGCIKEKRCTTKEYRDYYIVSGGICALGNEDALLGSIDFDKIPTKRIIIDMSTEAINFQLENDFYTTSFKALSFFLKKPKYSGFLFYIIHANSAKDRFIKAILEKIGISNENLMFLGFDFYFLRFYLDMMKSGLFNQKNTLNHFREANAHNAYTHEKYFLCMNHRPRWHRYAIVLSLMAHNNLEKGFVSFAGNKEGRVDAPTVDTLEEAATLVGRLQNASELLKYIHTLDEMSPLTLDRKPEQIQTELWGKEKTGNIGQPLLLSKQLKNNIPNLNSCYFEIVTETYFTDAHCSYLTEKILRPIVMMRPFIHVGTPFMLEKLKHYGFKTFTGFIDESYDQIEDPAERMNQILVEVNKLCAMSPEELTIKVSIVEDVLIHNYNHFKNNSISTSMASLEQLF